jgi:hypothetical protein
MFILWVITFAVIWFRKELPERTLQTSIKVIGVSLLSVLIVSALVAGFCFIFD